MRVRPAASAVSMASVVGAETAISTGAPSAAVFWTISTDSRLVTTTAAGTASRPDRAAAPTSLSSAL